MTPLIIRIRKTVVVSGYVFLDQRKDPLVSLHESM
jgi:hypothetical protein